ncbi:MAG: hypothetical protein DRP35_03900 [Candidatus Zixiibacteriota bacterium]|nr:MAG: hypothetical protein DRP35_03900 [candidate division Zixibacteria bacterium]
MFMVKPLCGFIIFLLFIISCGKQDIQIPRFEKLPEFVSDHQIKLGSEILKPVRIQYLKDTLFVSYVKKPKIDIFNTKLEQIGTIDLSDPTPIFPTAFNVTDSFIYVTDHAKHVIVTFDRQGNYISSFGTLPDGITELAPFSLFYFGGVLYVSDSKQKGVLAISVVDAEGITEKGELILSIPADTLQKIDFPSALYVTEDGRMIIGDASSGSVHAYTCNGHFIYHFDTIPNMLKVAPQAIAQDNIIDPSLQDTTKFDPSYINFQGRFHVVDPNNSAIHMYNPKGYYVATYTDSLLVKPSGIAIDMDRFNIYIADPVAMKIFKFRY